MTEKNFNVSQERDENTTDNEKRIRDRAHEMWEADGRPEGREEQYWLRAREMISAEGDSAYPPTQARGHRN
ncbi:DUF2934 domain-containing protein [Methylobacterium sp. GC_Met_2]|uniref:DUF2934 domain-containing protein n=1 Tax=Methylobacterium sp. GC_Met_2 TaxID=2937376 RepID=UPI00226B2F4E|nr:DUF2934 domain-containing protein [Methylobacterium sp. GC_Met_2]